MQQKLGFVMSIASWALLIILTGVSIGFLTKPPAPVSLQGSQRIELKQQPGNLYYAPGTIEGVPVQFIVDTGASMVAVPDHIARQAGLKRGPTRQVSTAAGVVEIYLTKIKRLTIGNIELRNVVAGISIHDNRNVLLGMSALKMLTVNVEGDTLIITQD